MTLRKREKKVSASPAVGGGPSARPQPQDNGAGLPPSPCSVLSAGRTPGSQELLVPAILNTEGTESPGGGGWKGPLEVTQAKPRSRMKFQDPNTSANALTCDSHGTRKSFRRMVTGTLHFYFTLKCTFTLMYIFSLSK